MLITDAIEGFLIDLRARKRSPNTLRHYEHKLRIWSKWMEQHEVCDIYDITITHLRAFMLELERTPVTRHHPGRREQDGDPMVSDITMHGYAQALKTFCSWLVAEELLDKDPAIRLAKPTFTKKLIRSFTTRYLQAMFAACDLRSHLGFRDYTLMLALIDTGMRASEVCTLRIEDAQGDHIIIMGKGRKQREIGIMPTTAKFLWKYIKVHRHPSQPTDRLFLGQRGTPLTPSGLDQALYRIRDAIGLHDVRLSAHTFRHSFARVWLERGGEIYSLSRLMGHASVQVTEVYLRDFEARQARLRHNEFSPLADFQLPRGKRSQPLQSTDDGAPHSAP